MEYLNFMKIRYYIWYVLISCVLIFGFYYSLTFCSIYVNASKGWLYGCIMSFVNGIFIVQIGTPFVKALLREIIKIYPEDLKKLISIY